MKNKKCPYYIGIGGCSHMNDIDEPGECVYGNGVIRENAAIHCSEGRKRLKIEIE